MNAEHRRALDGVLRTQSLRKDDRTDPTHLKEWLVTNGLGGYASGTVCGIATRRFHGLLIAALPAPAGRTMMLNRLGERIRPSHAEHDSELGAEEPHEGDVDMPAVHHLLRFSLEAGLPFWEYEVHGAIFKKTLWLAHRQNTVYLRYELVSGADSAVLFLTPGIHFRPHEGKLSGVNPTSYHFRAHQDGFEVHDDSDYPALQMQIDGAEYRFDLHVKKARELRYRIEQARGYDYRGDLYIPGAFAVTLQPGVPATFIASTESVDVMQAMSADYACDAEHERRRRLLAQSSVSSRAGVAAELVLAADQFLITPVGRTRDVARARASGDEIKTVIAGYHWFTDWGRDTMISLEGLTLVTGRKQDAGYILRTFGHYIRDGLIPNMFPEGKNDGLYHTADATLWFFHALSRYLAYSEDRATLRQLLPRLLDVVDHHVRGTRFGIGVDPQDGLLKQGAEGYQLTWMDAKVEDWVVTPRRGKAVEINALWYNALMLLQSWLEQERPGGRRSKEISELAQRCRESFNRRFWNASIGHLNDVIDCDGVPDAIDTACRPNQLFSFSLDFPVLDEEHWK
ncbi:MAG: glycogen debranching enzyme N-terminal domain-containing protein, partial [Acidobacteriales bacterium]|nr:glycogen debranching enzyme N-terminal domain-containing protein [Terriglobales bacterium]